MEKKTKKRLFWSMLMNFITGLFAASIVTLMDEQKSKVASFAIFFAIYMIAYAAIIILVGLYRKFVLKRSFFPDYLL